ncbi:hypothetical protein FRC04_007962 [Tulasnella sp. 424]|nr:hypothetical protein FRC04_007962 [Tulasnella sp. 424]KAG8974823.1 hypothetical protein FRC05_006755 [Tulasnella sp. 425]
MGSSILGFLVWMSLLLANNHSSVLANLTNTTLYSTHPQVTYAPESCCMKGPFGRCMKRYDPFTMTTYVGADSTKRTFFQTSSWGNEPNSSNMKRRAEISFYGQAVYVYSPPRAQLENLPGHIQISLNGLVLATIDLEAKYRETDDDLWSPRLIYHWQGVNIDASHTLQISLLDSASKPIRGFGIDSVVYTSSVPRRPYVLSPPSVHTVNNINPPNSTRYELSESEKLEEVAIHDTNFVTTFTPAHAWEKHVSAFVSSQGIRTFHGTSNKLAYTSYNTAEMPVAEFTAQCAALAIYGASPIQVEAIFAEGFRHGHLQICIGTTCEYIDTHQVYLHVPEHLRNEPALIYSTDRMSPRSPQAVKIRLLDPPSPVGHLWTTTFSHAVCSQVVPKWPWTHPIPNGRYSTHIVPFDKLDYAPSFLFGAYSPWSRMDRYNRAPAEPYWFAGILRDMPSHDIKIFVPQPALFTTSQYANVRCCIDGRCHYPDIEQWLMKARDSQSDILLVHYQDLNPFQAHQISMTAVRKEDEVGDKLIAVSRVEYQRVEVIRPPPPRPPPPSSTPTPTRRPQMPTPDKPVQHDDNGIVAAIFAAVATIVFTAGAVIMFAVVAVLAFAAVAVIVSATVIFGPNTTYHHRRQRSIPFSGTAGFTPNGYRSGNGQPLPDGTQSRCQQPVYNTNSSPPGSSIQFASDALSPVVRAARPFSPTSTDSDILSQCFDRPAPPSYNAYVTSDAVITTPPRPHASITLPGPPPLRRT